MSERSDAETMSYTRGPEGGPRHASTAEKSKESVVTRALRRHDLSAEKAVLAAMLLDNRCIPDVEAILAAEDFYWPANATIYQAMLAIAATGTPVDILTLAADLRARNRIHTVGGPQYLGELTDELPTASHVESHARIVADEARVRRLATVCVASLTRAAEGTAAEELCGKTEEQMLQATARKADGGLQHIHDGLVEYVAYVETALASGREIEGTPTGFLGVDRLLGGMRGGQSILLAARPAMGKTAIVGTIALHAARYTRQPVLFFSLEMPRRELLQRFLAQKARIDHSAIRSLVMTDDQTAGMFSAAVALSGLPVWIDDTGELTIAELRAKSRRIAQRHGKPAVIIVDYLQLLKPQTESASRERDIGKISRALKSLAKELDVPVLSLSQLNRDCETRADKRPMLSDLRESGTLEQDADVVLFLYRDVVYNPKTEDRRAAEVIVAKQRNGPTDTALVRFIQEHSLFLDPGSEDVGSMETLVPDGVGGTEETFEQPPEETPPWGPEEPAEETHEYP